MHGVSLGQLRALLAVAERGSFSEAAFDLKLNQSSVSHAVAELERALGAPLLTRGRGGARLTPLGERVAGHARTALGALESMRQEVELARGTVTGTLQVATLRSAGTHLLPPILAELRLRAPQLQVSVLDETGERVEEALNSGRAEVGLLNVPLRSSLLAWPIARDEYLAVYPRGAAPARLSWEELERAPFLLCNEECARLVRAHAERCGRTLPATRGVREDSVILSMVGHGLGISILPRLAIVPQPDSVVTLPLPDPLWRTLAVATLPNRASTPGVRAFVESARKVWGGFGEEQEREGAASARS